jgi:hypothetical protein
MTAAETSTRRCETCTACCDGWLKITVYGQAVYPGKPCPFSSGHHCTIYETRPDPCRTFVCGWLARGSPLPEWMRPDRAGVILMAASFTWRGLQVDVAVPVGKGPKPEALEWLTAFATTSGRPSIYQVGDDWYAFGPPAFQAEMRERISRGEKLWE